MKVKVVILRTVEAEIDSPSLIWLNDYWRKVNAPIAPTPEVERMVDVAVKDVETTLGLPFGDDNALETISAVYAMDDEAILEW